MKNCFVSMPLGTKQDARTGLTVDFDRVYAEIVAPAIEAAQLSIRSWRSASAGASMQKQALGDIMSSDILLADVTTANPNVMYELGVRHASNRGPTVLIGAAGGLSTFYVEFLQTIIYDPVEDLSRPEAFRSRLSEALRTAARRAEGSPLYEFFPGLRVELPAGLGAAIRRGRAYPEPVQRALTRKATKPHGRQRADVKEAEEVLRATEDASPAAYLDLLRAYRDASDWDGLIRAAETLPSDVAEDPQALQLLALALNRRSEGGDQDRAVALMRRLVDETGGDPETFGILGRIFKDRWRTTHDPTDLKEAVSDYRRGFELQPNDFYTGFNAVALLFIQNEPAADAELAGLLPRVKEVVQQRLTSGETDYWVFSVALEIAVIERDWSGAGTLLDRALALRPSAWVRESSAESLERLGRRFDGPDADALSSLIGRLSQDPAPEDEYA